MKVGTLVTEDKIIEFHLERKEWAKPENDIVMPWRKKGMKVKKPPKGKK